MKTVLLAWIEQVVSFANKDEAYAFLTKLQKKPYPSKVLWIRTDAAGTVYVGLRKAYNNSPFPGDLKEEAYGTILN